MKRPGLTLLFLFLGPIFAHGAEKSSSQDFAFFESKIRPVLVEHCYECHSIHSGKSKGELLLDSRAAIRAGGSQGPAVTPGAPAKSLLLAAIRHADPDLEMPPRKARLPDEVIASFEKWIQEGALDPREAASSAKKTSGPPVSVEEGRRFWAFQKPVSPEVPTLQPPASWPGGIIDRFILEKLRGNGLDPSPDADPLILLRRLHFDLAGLPPSPIAIERFRDAMNQQSFETAWESEIDRLLKSDRFGERWARHWLDVIRFAESSGKESNVTFPHAWRFRDYLIDCFNENVPFDRLLLEHLAGDLLPAESDAERARLLVATGFLAFGPKNLGEMNKSQFRADLADEQIDALSRAVMGQSISCARCHDHKFDPFSMKDYYALAGIFRSTATYFGTWIDSENNVGGDLITLPRLKNQLIPNRPIPKAKVEEMKERLAELNRQQKAGPKDLRDAIRIIWQRGGLEGKLETVDAEGAALPLAMGTLDASEIDDAPLLERGEVAKPGQKIPRAFPAVFHGIDTSPPRSPSQSGRLELAKWVTHPDHPLTARVMANRIWKQLIGQGIVRTMDNFGFTGEAPDHPELLDYLAVTFQKNGWPVKSLIREIVMSRTYRQSSAWREKAFLKDPENRLLWRIEKQRLEAECIRDSMLFVSGNLDLSRRPGSLVAEVKGQSVALFGFNKQIPRDLDGSRRRSVYLPVVRDRLPDVLALFDFAEPSLVTGKRDTTNVPVQALYLLNSDFVLEQSAALARRVSKHSGDDSSRIDFAFQVCLTRLPLPEEQSALQEFLTEHRESGVSFDEWKALCQSLLASSEFRSLD